VVAHRFIQGATLTETASRMQITPEDALALQWAAVQHVAGLIATACTGPGVERRGEA
jgi:hypothetical protein